MPNIQVSQMWSADSFDTSSENGFRKMARIVTAYQVTCDPTTTKVELSNAAQIPVVGDSYPQLSEMYCTNRAFKRQSPVYWIATLTYEGKADDPLGEPPEVSWTDADSDEPIDQDWNGKPIVTVNGEPIDGVTMKIADNVLTVKRNYRAFSPSLTSQYRHSVNSDEFQGYSPGTGRLTKFSAKQIHYRGSFSYWEVTASIRFRFPYNTTPDKAWYARVRHEGFYEKLSTGEIVRAVDQFGEPVTKPVLLKADGTRELNSNNAHWLEFQRYQALPYSALGLL